MKVPLFIFLLMFTACSSKVSEQKNRLLTSGLAQSALFFDEFVNFAHENHIERRAAQMPQNWSLTAKKMRKIWKLSAPFDNMQIKDTTLSRKTMTKTYRRVLYDLNELSGLRIKPLHLRKKRSLTHLYWVYQNHLTLTKHKILLHLIDNQPYSIRYVQPWIFQHIEAKPKHDSILLTTRAMGAPLHHSIILDSLTHAHALTRESISIDSSIILGNITVRHLKKGKYTLHGKVKVRHGQTMSFVYFKHTFEKY